MRNDYLRRYSSIRSLCCIFLSCRFSKLEDENIHPEKKCVYGDINYSNSVNGIRYQLDNFCSIRDKLERINKIKSDRGNCSFFKKHMHTYTKEILLLLYSIQDDNKLKRNFF